MKNLKKIITQISQNIRTPVDPASMKLLTEIAFDSRPYDHYNYRKDDHDDKTKKKDEIKNFAEDNNVSIGKKIYLKNTQFNEISSKVLGMCNIYSTKSKFNNTSLKARTGKTMITKGMSVQEFEKKYNLQEK